MFKKLQIMTSCYVAFSNGANDVANAVGPVPTAIMVIKTDNVSATIPVPVYLLTIGALGIGIGTATWGYKVMHVVAEKITEITNTRGFSIDFAGASSIILVSKLGMPVSTTHAVVGAVIGVE